MSLEDLKIDRNPRARRAQARRSPWFGRVVAVAVISAAIWVFWGPISGGLDQLRLPTVSVFRVAVSHPAAAAAVQGTAANGHIIAARRAALSADTPGRIVELNVTEGSLVRKGDIVARLYSDEYAAALRQAEAELGTAKARVKRADAAIESARAELTQREKNREASEEAVTEAEAQQQLAAEEHEREKDLHERGVSSQSAYNAARAELDTASAKLRGARARQRAATAAVILSQSRVVEAQVHAEAEHANVSVVEAARELAAATLAKTEVRAPFDGMVVLKDAEVGEVVSPNSQGGSNARGSVCTMVDLKSLEVQAEVQETSMAAVEIGADVSVFLDAYPETLYRGKVDRIWPTANRQKGSIEVRIAFSEPDDRLRPEMGVRVVFGLAPTDPGADKEPSTEAMILIPADAIIEISGDEGVFLLERDTVVFAPLTLGEMRGGRVTVRSGLTPGQRIVLDPPLTLTSGDRVRIRKS